MAIDREKLGAIIAGKARTLCSTEGDRFIDSKKGVNRNIPGINPLKALNESEDYYGLGDVNMSYQTQSNETVKDINYTYEDASFSKMPEAIKQSMLENRIEMTGDGLSVLDSMNIKEIKKPLTEIKTTPTPQTQQTNYMPMVSGVDYSIIKAIVNECLNEYFSKNMINENASLQTIALKDGNISLVDNKGNIFKAKLERIGNKNDKK